MGYVLFLAEKAEKMGVIASLEMEQIASLSAFRDFRSKWIETRLSLALFLLAGGGRL
jgi:hypothetical protein